MQDGLQDHDDAAGFWKARDLPDARGSEVPTFWSHGFMDANTKPDNFVDVWTTLKGPHRAWFGQFEHVRGNESDRTGRKGFFDEAFRWLDRYVKGDATRRPVRRPGGRGRRGRRPLARRGRVAAGRRRLPPDGAQRRLLHGRPEQRRRGLGAGNGIWSISAPLPYDVHLAGVPKVSVDVTTASPRATLVGLLYDIDAESNATLIQRGAMRDLLEHGRRREFELYPDDWTLRAGHRIGVLVAGSTRSGGRSRRPGCRSTSTAARSSCRC